MSMIAGRRTTRPVLVWASLGAAFTILAAITYTRWLADLPADVGTGADEVPASTEVVAIGFQIVSLLIAVGVIVAVIRQCFRQRRLTFDAMLVTGWIIAWWHDPLINLTEPGVLYNTVLVDRGSPIEGLPGWAGGELTQLPEPIFMIGAVYVWLGIAFAVLSCIVMRAARARWPRLGNVGTFFAAYAVVAVAELALEVFVITTELIAYPTAIAHLTLNAGQSDQIPIYLPLLWSLVLTASGALRFFVDADGRTVVERGIGQLRVSPRVRVGLSLLAVIGFVHVTAIGYDVAVNLTVPFTDPAGPFPSYLAP